MCLDGNSAPLSVRYLNSQLSALWENAHECMSSMKDSASDVRSEKYEKSKYTRALAQFQFFGKKAPKTHGTPSTADFHFYATFGKPELQFICNHDAILSLSIEDGHANLDYTKVTTTNVGGHVDPQKTVPLHDIKLTYRLEFERSKIKGRDTRIGNHEAKHLIQLMILKLESAVLVDVKSDQDLTEQTRTALQAYMNRYLEFLRRAGNHVLFDLSDFDNDRFKARIDYSQHRESLNLDSFVGGTTVKSIELSDINEQLMRKWAASHRLFLVGAEDKLATSLAVFSSQWLTNFNAHFFIQFRAPYVKALCSHEVILHFDISRLWFFSDNNFSSTDRLFWENWTIAFIVDVVEVKEESVTELRLDFSNARISRVHSTEVTEEIAIQKFNLLVYFFQTEYFSILRTYSMHVMYHVDELATGIGGIMGHGRYGSGDDSDSASWNGSDSEDEDATAAVDAMGAQGHVSIYASIISKMSLFGFDQVTALSEEAMNTVFASMYTEARNQGHMDYDRIYRWEKSNLFIATFGGISVHLLSGNKAVVGITIDEGSIYTKRETHNDEPWRVDQVKNYFWPTQDGDNVKYDFGELTLVYEVDIKLVDDSELDGTEFYKHFLSSELYQVFNGKAGSYNFKHVLLDVRRAKFISDLSNTLAFGKDTDGVTRLELVQHYIREYLDSLANNGYNVVHSLPFLVRPDLDPDSYAFTAITYQVISKYQVTIQNCTYRRNAADAPALLIYGMSGGRTMPSAFIQWLTSWTIPGSGLRRKSFGTVCLSKSIFLETRLLRLLEIVNRKTTLVPKFAGVIANRGRVELSTWDDDVYRKDVPCLWEAKGTSGGFLDYVWEHRDEYSHEHEGTAERMGGYSARCVTKNKLRIPASYQPRNLRIVLTGDSSLDIKGRTGNQKWSKRTNASWEVALTFHSEPNGLIVSADVVKAPQIQGPPEAEEACEIDVAALHHEHLQLIDFQSVALELNNVLAGAWQYSSSSRHRYALSNPMFTREGDLFVQLIELKKGVAPSAPGQAPNGLAADTETQNGTTYSSTTATSTTAYEATRSNNSYSVNGSTANGFSTSRTYYGETRSHDSTPSADVPSDFFSGAGIGGVDPLSGKPQARTPVNITAFNIVG